jgi:ATP-dependent Clp protease ATP-binding subunit ClpA
MSERSGERFDKFTERARKVLSLAHEEAARFNHNYIGTEHLLLGLVREGDGVAARVLSNMGVQLQKVRAAVEFIIGRGERPPQGEIGLTPRARRVIELAFDEARRQNHHYIGTEHLLLGLVREGEGIAAGVLESLGVSLEKVRAQVIRVINNPSGHGRPGYVLNLDFASEEPPGDDGEEDRATLLSPEARKALWNLEAYSGAARGVISQALLAAVWSRAPEVGTEHLLYALATPDAHVAGAILFRNGFTEERARGVAGFPAHPAGPAPARLEGNLGLSDGAGNALAYAFEAAYRGGYGAARTEHLLLGVLAQGDGAAVRILREMGIVIEDIEADLETVLGGS